MIDSIELKKFIIRYYLDHSISPIEEISKKVSLYLTNHFIPLESVKIENTNQIGKILSCTKDSYTVEVEGSIVKLRFEELSRNEKISALEIRRFLEANTKISPFGRVLRKNVLQQISQSNKEIKDDKDFNQNTKSKELKEDKIIFSYDPKIEINKKEPEKKRKKEKLSETINYNTRNFTANEFLKGQNEKSSFFKKELLYDDQPKNNLFLPTEQKFEKSKIQNFSLGTEIKKRKNEPITNKFNNESELLTLKIKEILKNYTFKTVTGENDLHFKRKINSLLDSKAIKNHPEEINIKRKLIELLTNPNSTNEFINFKVTELFNNTEKKKLKVEERINFLALLNEEVYEEILIEGVGDNDRFFSVFLFFYYFRKYFKFEFTFLRFKEFILGKKEETICSEENQPIIFLDSKSNPEIFYHLIKCTLEMIQEEFKLISKSQFKLLIENSLTISVKEPKEEGYSPSKKYDWHECEITLENYKNILKNFYSFIFNSLELEKITGLSEINTVPDKLNNLYFLIQCCYSTNKFRQIINLSVEDNRILEKNKYDLHARLKTLQSKLSFQPENKESFEEEIKVIENQLTKINYNLLTSGYKAEFALIDDCLFIFLNGVCFWRDHKFYKMSIEQLRRFIDRLKKNPKVYGNFYNSLSWWLEISFKQN